MTHEQNKLYNLKCYSATHEREETQREHGYNTCIYLTWYRLKLEPLRNILCHRRIDILSPANLYTQFNLAACVKVSYSLDVIHRNTIQSSTCYDLIPSKPVNAHTAVLRLAKPMTLPCNCSHKAIFVWPRSFLCP